MDTSIRRIQGSGLNSTFAGQKVRIRGVVTGGTRKGFFVQEPAQEGDRPGETPSAGLFVFQHGSRPPVGSLVEVEGEVIDYVASENDRPTTQLDESSTRVVAERGPEIEPFWLTADQVLVPREELARRLNALEGMVVGVPTGSTFAAPSNPFGDYVVLPPGAGIERTEHGGVLIDPNFPERWLPSLRVRNYGDAPKVHVGAELLKAVTGPLNYRSSAYQMACTDAVLAGPSGVSQEPTKLLGDEERMTIMTLNGFNLDPHREDPSRVLDPRRDVDDDLGDGRFRSLAAAIVLDARCPDVVALQEIQDNDGAEQSDVVSASRTLSRLCAAILHSGGPSYRFAEIPPLPDGDGGQPGGNIRNAYLYRGDRVELLEGSLQCMGEEAEVFENSRKPLVGRFRLRSSGRDLEVINVHLASKRHQHGLFAPEKPAFDPRLGQRVAQVEIVASRLAELRKEGTGYYVTGDFNDFEFSPTLQALCGDHSTNLLQHVPRGLRYDYNHRGLSQALMHGVVSLAQTQPGTSENPAEYEVLHANALLGTNPGALGEKPSDHAYVLARLRV